MSNLKLSDNIVTYLMTEYSFLDVSKGVCLTAVSNILSNTVSLDKAVLSKCEKELIKIFASSIKFDKQKVIIYEFLEHEFLNKKHDNLDKLKNVVIFFDNMDKFKGSKLYTDVLKNSEYLNDIVTAVTGDNTISIEEIMENPSINALIQDISMYNVEDEDEEIDIDYNYDKNMVLVDSDAFSSLLKGLTRKHGKTIPTEEENRKLIEQAQSGDYNARNLLIEKNWRLILSVAKRYSSSGIPLIDLFQEGCIGMAKGIDYFDLSRDVKLGTYCIWWIRQAIIRSTQYNSKMIRLPVHVQEKVSEMLKVKNQFIDVYGREPSDEELAKKLHMSVKNLKKILTLPNVNASLNSELSDDKDADELGDIVADESALSPEDAAINSRERLELDYYLGLLPQRTADVIRLRFGFYDCRIFKLEEIGKIIGVTRERIRQIESNGLRILHNYMTVKKLPSTLTKYDVRYISDKTYKKIFDYYKNCINTKTLKQVVSTLDDIDIFVMNEVFSNERCGEGAKNIFLDTINVKILCRLSKTSNNKSPKININDVVTNTLKLYFSQYPMNVVEDVVNRLNENDIEVVLYKCLPHRRNLNINMKDVDIYFYNSIISRVYEILDDICPEVNVNRISHVKVSEYEYFSQYSKEVIDKVVSCLPEEEKAIFDARFRCAGKITNEAKREYLYYLDSRMRNALNVASNGGEINSLFTKSKSKKQSIYDYFVDYPIELVDEVLEGLSDSDKKLLEKIINNVSEMSKEEKRQFNNSLLNNMRKKVKSLAKNKGLSLEESESMSKERNKDRYDYFKKSGTQEEIDGAFESLNDKDRTIAEAYFSEGELSALDKENFRVNVLPKIKRRIIAVQKAKKTGKSVESILKSRSGKRNATVYEYFARYGTSEQIDAAMAMLSEEDRALLNSYFANDTVTAEIQSNFYSRIVSKMKTRIKNVQRQQGQTVSTIGEVINSSGEISERGGSIDVTEDEKVETAEKLVECPATEEDLKITITSGNIIHVEGELIKEPDKSEDNLFMQLFKYPHFQERAKQLPFEDMMAISLKLWYNAGTDQIASVLGMDISRVNEITSNALNNFRADLMSFLNGNGTFNAEPLQLKEGKSPYVKSLSSQNSENKGN